MTQIATLLCYIGIPILFWLDRDRNARASRALWIPVAWMWIACSRSISEWIYGEPTTVSADQYLDGSPLDRVVLTCILALGLIVLIRRRHEVAALLRANPAMFVFFAYCALSMVWSDYPGVAFKRWTKALGNLIMVLIVLTDLNPVAAMRKLLARTGFVLVPLSILFIKYYPDLGRQYNRFSWTPAFVGVTTNKNELGMICLIFGLGFVWRLLRILKGDVDGRKGGPVICHLILMAMVFWLFLTADSQTSFACFLLAGTLMAVTQFPIAQRRPIIVHTLAFGSLGICVLSLFSSLDLGLVQTLGRDTTLTGRTEIWDAVLGMAGNRWVGTGFESFWLGDRIEKMWKLYWWHPNEAHNGYIEIYLSLGWIGIALLAAVILAAYRNGMAAYRADPATGGLKLAFLISAVIYNLTEAAFKGMNPIWIVFLWAALAVPVPQVPEEESSEVGDAANLITQENY